MCAQTASEARIILTSVLWQTVWGFLSEQTEKSRDTTSEGWEAQRLISDTSDRINIYSMQILKKKPDCLPLIINRHFHGETIGPVALILVMRKAVLFDQRSSVTAHGTAVSTV